VIGQEAYTVLFYVLGAAAVVMALVVVNAQRLLRAAVCLMGVLFTTAGLYVMLGAEFLAGVQVLVYVGGIVVLIAFAIMLTHSSDLQADRPSLVRRALAALGSLGFLAVTLFVLQTSQFPIAQATKPIPDNTAAIGRQLLDSGPGGYVLPFEVISLLLLAAVLGGIVAARKTPPPRQPFTSGGDLPGEADVTRPRSQRWEGKA
jgi:NADH-quinone oxidoreductase subunit J